MSEAAPPLTDPRRVLFVGRLALGSRAKAAAILAEREIEVAADFEPGVTHVVLGERGWPVASSGRLPKKLCQARAAHRAGAMVAIVREQQFFARLCADSTAPTVARFTLADLIRHSGVPGQQLRAWLRREWIVPAETRMGQPLFGYEQLTQLRGLAELLKHGASPRRLGRSLRQLRRWFPEAEHALQLVADLARERRLLTRTPRGQLAEPGGQLVFEFTSPRGDVVPLDVTTTVSGSRESGSPIDQASVERMLDQAAELEDAGRLAEAAAAYEKIVAGAPVADGWFNLGNVRFALDQLEGAAAAYRSAVAIDPGFTEAWNNLGGVLMDLGDWPAAEEALRRAVRLNPRYADAHYNLADLLAASERWDESRHHRREYRRWLDERV